MWFFIDYGIMNAMILNNLFDKRMKAILGDEYDEFEKALSRDKVSALRTNTLKYTEDNELHFTFSDKNVPWESNALIYTDGAPGKHPFHEAGVYYIQEPSAMAPVHYLDPKPGEKILDLCAAPGGKTTQIASRMKDEGIIVTNEIDKKRAQILSLNVERCGIKNALVTNADPAQLSEIFEGYFDRILVDAPCSGEGMFRKSDEAVNNWSIDNVMLCADRQKNILDEAVKMLAPGGRLVYSTCTFAPEEDEEAALYLLQKGLIPVKTEPFPGMIHGNTGYLKRVEETYDNNERFKNVVCDDDKSQKVEECSIRLFPHLIDGEGHFLCAFEKEGDIELNKGLYGTNGRIKAVSQNELKIFAEFARDVFADDKNNIEVSSDKSEKGIVTFLGDKLKGTLFMFGDHLYLAPVGMPGLGGLKVMRPGLHLGTIKKDRFEPSHALALFLKKEDVKRERYTRGPLIP